MICLGRSCGGTIIGVVLAESGIQPESISEAFHAFQQGKTPGAASPLSAAGLSNQTIQESMRLLLLIRAYQVRPLSAIAACTSDCTHTSAYNTASAS